MKASAPITTFATADELSAHLAKRARGEAAGADRSLVDILSPLVQRTEAITGSIRAGEGRYSSNTAHDELQALLERCERDATQAGKPVPDIEDAVLAVVAWIDETVSAALSDAIPDAEPVDPDDPFADPEAPDAESQKLYRLQTSRFDISDAGVRFFDKLSTLTDDQNEVREVYVAVLELGFRGQYFSEDDRRQLGGIKQEHAERLLRAAQSQPAAPPAAPRRIRRWVIAAAAALVVAVGGVFAYNWYSECNAYYGGSCTQCKLNPETCFH